MRFAGSGILLDIEGTVSSIRFVYDTMFPYVRAHLAEFLQKRWDEARIRAACDQAVREATHMGLLSDNAPPSSQEARLRQVMESVGRLMDADAKTTGLKELQGLIWDGGFRSGELQSQVYDDVPVCLTDWRRRGIDVRIYSSGSVAAQKLFFAHTQYGDLSPWFGGYYDTTTGQKREPASYQQIASDMRRVTSDVLFLSDVLAELDSASEAGMATALVRRPENPPPSGSHCHPVIRSLADVEID